MTTRTAFAALFALVALLTGTGHAAIVLHSTFDNGDVNRGGLNPPPALNTDDGNWTAEDTAGTPQNGTAIADNTNGGQVISSASGIIQESVLLSANKSSNRRVDYGNVFNTTAADSITVSMWINSNSPADLDMIASKGNAGSTANGWSIFEDDEGSGILQLRADYSGNGSANNLGLNRVFTASESDQWHHVALVIDNAQGKLFGYYDGLGSGTSGTDNGWSLGGSGAETNTFAPGRDFSTSSPILLGLRDDLDLEWDGRIDDFAIFDTALSASEIDRIYQGGLIGLNASQIFVPEPGSLTLLVGGLLGLAAMGRRRRR